VLRNLISNAAKHGRSGGWVGIRAACPGKHQVDIIVSDHGPGIPKQELSELFKPFYRGRRALEEQVRGSGIGLSLVQEIVRAHQGHISVCSEEGKGTSFTISLPSVSNGEIKNPDH
jgi:signal transduction histidine kinase